ncbi:hypothetical protein NDU88_007230 [Pleurodeles waltl]|uniref:Uncharacterized protein n=1 Tax=Pleurodeles waltl TaxID=8319 RepID=A0AAV7NWS5_PLEWA|nr:hypothetical protein NDU88_007230 [Pleurodeles waltl]
MEGTMARPGQIHASANFAPPVMKQAASWGAGRTSWAELGRPRVELRAARVASSGNRGQSRATNRGRGSFPPVSYREGSAAGGLARQIMLRGGPVARHRPWSWAPPQAQGGEATALTGWDTWRCGPRRRWEVLAR